MATDNPLSVLVESRLPSYLADEGPNLVAFFKAYYEWLETTNQVNDRLGSMLDYNDIDKTLGEFITFFQREVLSLFPNQVLADKRLLAKNIKDLYQAKGTEESFKLLFRILFDEEIDFFIPEDFILKASDGRWVQENSIRVSGPFTGNPENFGGRRIVGETSGATATVDRSTGTTESGIIVYELFLTSISGNFVDNEVVRTTTSDIQAQIVSAVGPLTGVTITSGGSGHRKDDVVNFTSTSGSSANGIVETTIDTGVRVSIVDGGSGYRVGTPVIVTNGGVDASFVVNEITNTSSLEIAGNTYTVGTISSIATLDQGTGYDEPLTATASDSIVAPENLNTTEFTIVDGGSGYTNNATITITGGGGGVGASFDITSIVNTEVISFYNDNIASVQNVPLNTGPTFVSTGANTTAVSSNLASSNVSSTLISALATTDLVAGSIGSIAKSNNGVGYTSDPTVNVNQENVSALNLDDGSGGIKGNNAIITANVAAGFLGNNAVLTANVITGSILTVSVSSGGSGYSRFDPITISNQTRAGTVDAIGNPTISGIVEKEGRYTDTKGFLSSNMRLQDSFYYQSFSYVIRSEQFLERYKDIVTRLVHPSGSKLFGSVTIESPINLFNNISIETDASAAIIGDQNLITIPSAAVVSANNILDMNIADAGNTASALLFGTSTFNTNINPTSVVEPQFVVRFESLPVSTFEDDSIASLFDFTLESEQVFPKFGNTVVSTA